MKEIDDKIFLILRKSVENTFGKKISYSKDCTALSVEILKSTNRLISETTLKRVWNLVSSKFNPSKYTLDTLSIYLGFPDWDSFVENVVPKQDTSIITMWNTIKKKSTDISNFSLDSIKSKIGEAYQNALPRRFFEEKIENFLKSEKAATAFIAPGGYGKSLLITKEIEKLYLSENAVYPNDILWFIDCGSVNLIDSEKFNIDFFFLELMGHASHNSFNNFFTQHPEDLKGNMIFVIDALNELSTDYERLNTIVENLIKIISINGKNHWFKMILTCRNNIWDIFFQKLENRPDLQKYWFDIDFNNDYQHTSNIPLLTDKEINKILQKNKVKSTFENIRFNDLTSYEIIRIPYFLYLYMNLFQSNEQISDITILKEYVNQKIKPNSRNSRIEVIYKILENNNLGLDKNKTLLEDLIPQINEKIKDYNELVNIGILHEKNVETRYLQQKISIQFTHELLYEFLITNYWLENNKLCLDLLDKVYLFYENFPNLQENILNWLIKYAFYEKNLDIIKGIYKFLHKNYILNSDVPIKIKIFNTLSYSIGNKIRKYPDIQKNILDYYAQDKLSAKYYFEEFCDRDFLMHFFGEAIDKYLEHNISIENQTFGFYIKFLMHYLKNEEKELNEIFEKMSSIDFSETDHFTFNYYFSCKILYQCNFLRKADTLVIDFIKDTENDYIREQNADITILNYSHISVVDAFNYTGMHDNAIEFANGIMKYYRITEKAKKSKFYIYLQILYADSLLQVGKEKEAFEIFDNYNIKSEELYSINSKFYWSIRFYLIKINFLIYQKNYSAVIEIYEEVLHFAKLLKFIRVEKHCKKRIKEIKEKNLSD